MTSKSQAGLIKIIDAVGCMEKCLSCAICLEILSDPVETCCGHLFCRQCIQKVLSHPGESCPVCKFNLTRRSVSSSGQMGLCIKQLSKLVDAMRNDTGIDITSCLETQYKKTFFLPSVYLSSPQSQQDAEALTSASKSDNTRKNPQNNKDESAILQGDENRCPSEMLTENSFNQLREQTNDNLSRRLPTKSKLQDIPSKSATSNWISSSRIQNENVFPPGNSCIADESEFAVENSEGRKLDSKVDETTDQSIDESRQCLKEISAINQNRSLSSQSTKTWSRVAKFGKELRRSSGANAPRIRKKDKLCVNVRDKSALSNSLTSNSSDQEKSGQDRVDHDLNASMRLANRDGDDRNISDDKTNKTVEENPARFQRDDERTGKSREPVIYTCDQSHDENFALINEIDPKSGNIDANKSNKQFQYEGSIPDSNLNSDQGKFANKVKKAEKQLLEEKGKRSNASNAGVEKETAIEIARVAPKRINEAPKTGNHKVLRTKRTQYAERGQSENVVRFKKFGHLFKAQRKCVAFLYLGKTKPSLSDYSDGEFAGICRLCSSSRRSDEYPFAEKRSLGSTVRLNRAKSFESSSLSLRNLPNNPKLLPVEELCAKRTRESDTRIEDDGRQNAPKKLSISKDEIISTGKSPEISSSAAGKSLFVLMKVADKTPPHQRSSPGSSTIDGEKKRSDPHHEDGCSKNRSGEGVSHEMSCTENAEKSLPDDRESPESATSRKRKRSAPDHGDQFLKKQIENHVSPESSCMEDAEKTPPGEKESGDSLMTKRKRTRLNPDHKDECSKNTNGEQRVSDEKSCTEGSEFCRQNYFSSASLPSRESRLTENTGSKIHEVDATDVNGSSENENMVVGPAEIDFRAREATPTAANNSSRMNLSRKSSLLSPDVPKTVNCPKSRDPVGPEADALSGPECHAQSSERDAFNEMYGMENSMMDITGEELLLKKFEENLFGRKPAADNQRGESSERRGEDNETTAVGCGQKNSESALAECNESHENEDFMELTPTNQSLIHTNNHPEIRQNQESATAQPHVRILENSAQKKSSETPLRSQISLENNGGHIQTPAQSNGKIRPLYQSTPKSSQISTERCPSSVHKRQKEPDAANYSAENREHSGIARSLKLDASRNRRGCILCSGLTAKQCEDVKYLANLFNMQYTKKFSSDVTHVIVKTNEENNGACKTLKYLQGVAYRKWVLSFDWIVDCAVQRKLVNEEMYEVVDSTTLIAGPRKARNGENGPFENFVFLCVEPFQNISVRDYEDLLRHMGATVVQSLAELAAEESILKIIALQAECHEKKIIEWHQITKAVPVAQEWIVECVSQYRLVSLLPFLQELVPQDVLDLGFPDELVQDDDSDFMYDASA